LSHKKIVGKQTNELKQRKRVPSGRVTRGGREERVEERDRQSVHVLNFPYFNAKAGRRKDGAAPINRCQSIATKREISEEERGATNAFELNPSSMLG